MRASPSSSSIQRAAPIFVALSLAALSIFGCGARTGLPIGDSNGSDAHDPGTKGAACADNAACDGGLECIEGACAFHIPLAASCDGSGPGLSDCIDSEGIGDESCCESPLVLGGTFYRTYENLGAGPSNEADPATISTFRLDRYEVTVGRFRRFVEANWLPSAGAGKHAHLNQGAGLVDIDSPNGGHESGWQTDDDNGATTSNPLNFACDPGDAAFATWTDTPGANERLPINCVNSYTAYAFCIWDGGFLPSEAEWEYAAAGGAEQRKYPWGNANPGAASDYAIFNCQFPSGASGPCSDASNIARVGAATAGAARFGQVDLAGNAYEWTLDVSEGLPAYTTPCTDCGALTKPDVQWQYIFRGVRGGSFNQVSSSLPDLPLEGLTPWFRNNASAWVQAPDIGFRCARVP